MISKDVPMAFEKQGLLLSLAKILPRKQLKEATKLSARYKRILSSIKVVGIVEPMLVFPHDRLKGEYILLDGHIRLEALRELGETETFCLVATDDEAFTYNHHVCVMNAIQEHFMVSRAIENGVSKKKIAEMLCLDVETIRKKHNLLAGICDEAVELLKDKSISPTALREYRHVGAMRQIEMAELMNASNNYTVGYGKCLVAATPDGQLTKPNRPSAKKQFTAEDLAKIEREMQTIGQEMRTLEESHGENTLQLVVIVSYLKGLLGNANVVKFLARKYADYLSQFQKLVEVTSLDGASIDTANSNS